jgi:hypothetical protein
MNQYDIEFTTTVNGLTIRSQETITASSNTLAYDLLRRKYGEISVSNCRYIEPPRPSQPENLLRTKLHGPDREYHNEQIQTIEQPATYVDLSDFYLECKEAEKELLKRQEAARKIRKQKQAQRKSERDKERAEINVFFSDKDNLINAVIITVALISILILILNV